MMRKTNETTKRKTNKTTKRKTNRTTKRNKRKNNAAMLNMTKKTKKTVQGSIVHRVLDTIPHAPAGRCVVEV